MPTIKVSQDGKNFKVLVNYIQQGSLYSTEETANSEANKLRIKYSEL